MLADLAFVSDQRGAARFRYLDGPLPFRNAAAGLLQTAGPVFILTGFYIARSGTIETDGLSGAYVLAHCLRALNRPVVVPADEKSADILSRIFPADEIIDYPIGDPVSSRQFANRILAERLPAAVIAIERPGPSPDGTFRNAGGQDITPFTARMEYLWPDTCLTIGIGDGGNELGMGRLANAWNDGRPVCEIPAACTLLGSASDFAAWSLAAALEISTGTNLLPSAESIEKLLRLTSELGIVDGMTGKPGLSIDGYSLETVLERYRLIGTAAGHLRLAQRVIDTAIANVRAVHPIPLIEITPRFDPESNGIRLEGSVLLDSQIELVRKRFDEAELPVVHFPEVLSDPARPPLAWMQLPEGTVDLLDRPDGKVTTQATSDDLWIRMIADHGDWALIQTPDLALGWTPGSLLACRQTPPNPPDPWAAIVRPLIGDELPHVLSLNRLEEYASALPGTPYLWGGRSLAGLDCSAMTQWIFRKFGILLPRHSGDQRRCGLRVPFDELRPGDLVFATRLHQGFHHTGIVLSGGIQHACRTRCRVLIESLPEFRNRYQLIAARRISPFA